MINRLLCRTSVLSSVTRFRFSGFDKFNRNSRKPIPQKKQEKSQKQPTPQESRTQEEWQRIKTNTQQEVKQQKEEQIKLKTNNQKTPLFEKRQRSDRNTIHESKQQSTQQQQQKQKIQQIHQEKPSATNSMSDQKQEQSQDKANLNKSVLFQRRRPRNNAQRENRERSATQGENLQQQKGQKNDQTSKIHSEPKPDATDSKINTDNKKKSTQQQFKHESFEQKLKNARTTASSSPKNQTNDKKAEQPMKESQQNKPNQKIDLQELYKYISENYKKLFNQPINKQTISNLKDRVQLFRSQMSTTKVPTWQNYLVYGLIGSIILIYFRRWLIDLFSEKAISYNDMKEKILNDQVDLIHVEKEPSMTGGKPSSGVKVYFTDRNGNKFKLDADNIQTIERLVKDKNDTHENKTIIAIKKKVSAASKLQTLRGIFFVLASIYFIRSITSSMSRTSRLMNNDEQMDKMFGSLFGRNKLIRQTVTVKFNNVAGMDSAKKQITEFVDFLKNPARFHKLGARIPRGALLSGPPGTGKTLLAKACAGQANVAFYSLSGSEFVEMYVGVGASRVRNLFKEARQAAPAIIFIDEIDAVGKKRSCKEGQFGGNDQRDSTLNQLLVEMDGFNTKSNIVVFAATNKKELLDAALTRPGRFDRIIEVDLPDLEGRRQIFQVHLAPLKLNLENMSLQQYARRMATLTPGFSGADISNICNEAAIMAARKNRKLVEQQDFELANDRVISGTEKKSLMTQEQRKIVAYHESGRAVVSWFIEGASPLLKLTIIPRSKGSLGFAQYLPDDRNIHTKQNLLDHLCVMIAGRISEQIFFSRVTSGARDDLNKVAQLANEIVKKYGMTEMLGNVSFKETEYLKEYSEAYSKKIDEEVRKLVDNAQTRSRQLVLLHKDKIEKLAQKLLEKDTIDNKTIRDILGQRPFPMRKGFRQYIQNA